MYGYTKELHECPSPSNKLFYVALGWPSIGNCVAAKFRRAPSQPISFYGGLGLALRPKILQPRPPAIHFLVHALMDNSLSLVRFRTRCSKTALQARCHDAAWQAFAFKCHVSGASRLLSLFMYVCSWLCSAGAVDGQLRRLRQLAHVRGQDGWQ